MKIRTGFVSNSSSSSFVIQRSRLSAYQLDLICDHIHYAKDLDIDMTYAEERDAWSIEKEPMCVRGSTTMDNFDMAEFLDKIGISEEDIEWDG